MSSASSQPLNVDEIRKDFPILETSKNGRRLVYLDSAASSQRPESVLNAMDDYYHTTHANVHRGVYSIAENATALFEKARVKAGKLINAQKPSKEIVFSKNATESINLVSKTWGSVNLGENDVILTSKMEHHANLVPWLMLKEQTGCQISYLEIDSNGELILDDIESKFQGVKLLAITMASNVLGTIPPVKYLTEIAHKNGALVIADAAQFVPHRLCDVSDLNVDFLAFTGHKIMGPTGIGVLYGKEELLEAMPPFLGGGEMILDVTLDGFKTNEIPWKFEAGTPPIAEAVGLSAAIDYLDAIGYGAIGEHERDLLEYCSNSLCETFGDKITLYGPKETAKRTGLISFSFETVHPHDVAQILDDHNICVRAGHHCAKPLMYRLGLSATTRVSFSIYNDTSDVDALVTGLVKVVEMLG